MSEMLQVLIVEEPSSEPKEAKPANLVMLKTMASSLRDTIVQVTLSQSSKKNVYHIFVALLLCIFNTVYLLVYCNVSLGGEG